MTDTLLRIDNALLAGVMPSLPGKRPVLLKTARNLIGTNQSIQPTFGARRFIARNTMSPILGLGALIRAGVPTLYFATAANIYQYTRASGFTTPGSGFTGTNVDLWSLARWGTWMVASNDVDPVQIDKGAGFGNLAGSPPKAVALVPWKSFLLLFTDEGTFWSDEDDPETWTPAASNLAGDLTARDVNSNIKAAVQLGDMIPFYTQDQQRAVQFVSGNDVFGQFTITNGIGAVGKNAVCQANRRHYGWGPRGIWESDGVQFRYIDNPAVKDLIQKDLNLDLLPRVCISHVPQYKCVQVSYPKTTADGNRDGLLYNYDEQTWWILDYGRTASLEDSPFGNPLTGDDDGNIWELPTSHVVSGSAISGSPVETTEHGIIINNHSSVPYGDEVFGGDGGSVSLF